MKACQICLSVFEDAVRFCPFHGSELKLLPAHQFNVGDSICDFYLKKLVGHDGLGNIFCATRGDISYRFRLFSAPVLCNPARVKKLHEILEKEPLSGGGIPITDFDWLEDGTLFSVHPYIPGRSFRDLLGLNLKLSESEVAELLYQLLRAVKDIHTQGVVCGNLSLSNIILDNAGRVRIHDAGLWDLFRDEHFNELRDDNPDIFDDILDLMSPEVANGEKPSFQSDVYSCGAAACCLLCGKTESGSAQERMKHHVNGDTLDIAKDFAVPVSEDFRELLTASMIGNDGVRFQTPRAFITALLCTHEEINESEDSLSPELAEKLLSGAEKPVPHNSFVSLSAVETPPLSLNDIQNSKPEESTPQQEEISDDKNLEKASWDTLASLVGENLEEKPLEESQDTPEETPSESPESSEKKESTDDASFSSPFDDIIADINKDKLNDSGINSSISNSDSPSSSDDFFSSLLTTPQLSDSLDLSSSLSFNSAISFSGSLESDDTKKIDDIDNKEVKESVVPKEEQDEKQILSTEIADFVEKKDDSVEDKTEADEKKTDSVEEKTDSVEEKKEAVEEKTEADEKKDDSVEGKADSDEKKKELTEEKKEPAENKDDTAEKQADSAEAKPEGTEEDKDVTSSKPHKRIGRKNKPSEESGETTGTGTGKEKKRKRKQNRRTSFAPANEVEQADVEILPLSNPEDKPAYAPIPWMTVSSGYKAPESATNPDADRITAELEAPEIHEIEVEEFFDNENTKGTISHKKRNLLALIVILLVLILSVLIATNFVKSKRVSKQQAANEQTQQNDNEDVWKNKIDQFYQDLAVQTKESRQKALADFREMRNGNLDSVRQKECKKALIDTFRSQADTLKKSLKKSDEIADPLSNFDKLTAFDIAYNDCIFKIDATDNAEEQRLQCEKERDNGKLQVRTTSLQNAQKLIPELQNQHNGWSEVTGIYEDLSELARGMNIPQLNQELYEADQQKSKYEARLKSIDDESKAIAMVAPTAPADVVPEPVQTEPTPSEQQPDGLAATDTEIALNQADPNPTLDSEQPQVPDNTQAQAPEQPQALQNTQAQAPAQPQALQNTQAQAQPQAQQNTQAQAQPQAQQNTQTQAQPQALQNTQAQAPTTNNTQTQTNTQTAKTNTQTQTNTQTAKTNTQTQTNTQTAKTTNTAKGGVPTAKLLADASQALAKGDLAKAASLCDQAVNQEPKNARAWLMFASVSEKQGKHSQAVTQAEISCKLSPKATCYVQLGNFQSKAGMTAEAQKSYSKALELDPNNAQAKAKVSAIY